MLATLGVVGTSGCLRLTDQESGGDADTPDPEVESGGETDTATSTAADATVTTDGEGDGNDGAPTVTLSKRWSVDQQVRYVWTDDGEFVTTGYEGVSLASPADGTRWINEFLDGDGRDRNAGPPVLTMSEAFAATDDRLIFGFDGGNDAAPDTGAAFLAFDRASGERLWRVDMPGDGSHGRAQGVTVVDDTVVIASDDNGSDTDQEPLVYGVDLETGERRWETGTPDLTTGFISGVAAHEGTVFVTQTYDGTYLLDPRTGAVTDYREQMKVSVWGGTARDGTLFDISGNEVTAYRLDGDGTRWSVPDVGSARIPPTVDDDLVIVATQTGYVHAIEADTGEVRWTSRLDRTVRGLAASDDHVWAWAVGSTLAGYDRENGTLVYESEQASDLVDLGAIGDTLVVGGDPGTAYRID
jgi:outer membrane protein assembly factor BamB